ncbi:hypothetical protein TH468_18870 [Thalassospira sp. MCCC 1A03138]|nr:hypothetical protein TH468_18870 [Thalassospira sp. MCCC 1A03138]
MLLWRRRPRHFIPSDRCPVIIPFLFLPPETQKTRKSGSRFAGFVSRPICPVDFIFMSQRKEQIKNFFQKSRKKFPVDALRDRKGIFINILGRIECSLSVFMNGLRSNCAA